MSYICITFKNRGIFINKTGEIRKNKNYENY